MSSDDEPKALAVALVLALALYLITWALAGSPFYRTVPGTVSTPAALVPAATALPISALQHFLGRAETPFGGRPGLSP